MKLSGKKAEETSYKKAPMSLQHFSAVLFILIKNAFVI